MATASARSILPTPPPFHSIPLIEAISLAREMEWAEEDSFNECKFPRSEVPKEREEQKDFLSQNQ